ncbi:MAG: hypothetical protein ACYSW0_22135 [Planctomycetota bacterium]|jgi:hypothetical protein
MHKLFWEWRRRNLDRIFYLFAICIVLLAIAMVSGGCTGNINLRDPNDRFMVAQEGFNSALDSYLRNYALADPATQADWKANIWPHFQEANAALTAWDKATTDTNKERAYLALEDVLFDILRKYKLETPEPEAKKEGANDTVRLSFAGNGYQNGYKSIHALAADPY